MKSLILSSLILSSISFANVKQLATWTQDASSVQAVLYETLQTAATLDAQSRYPTGVIVRKQNTLVIETQTASLSCESKTLGMAMVISYRCNLQGNISTWTNDAGSVQAVLFDALETALSEDENSRYPSKMIVRKNGSLIVEDTATTLTCQSGTKGAAQVQNYACFIK